jgi:hypothetical protein
MTKAPSHHNAVAKSDASIPRTAEEATARGHQKAGNFNLAHAMADLSNKMGTHFSATNAKPGDVAWSGPCEASGTRVVCYYDADMQPTDCRNVPC